MTSPARDHTHGDDVRMRVRAPENAVVRPIRPGVGDPTACTRAIPRSPDEINGNKPGKIRHFLSQHSGEVEASLAAGWLGADRPRNLTDVAHDLLTGNLRQRAAGLIRLTVYGIAYTLCAAVDTNKRAAVVTALTGLALLAAWAIAALGT